MSKPLDAVARPGATIGHHDAVDAELRSVSLLHAEEVETNRALRQDCAALRAQVAALQGALDAVRELLPGYALLADTAAGARAHDRHVRRVALLAIEEAYRADPDLRLRVVKPNASPADAAEAWAQFVEAAAQEPSA